MIGLWDIVQPIYKYIYIYIHRTKQKLIYKQETLHIMDIHGLEN